jgi:hypothetical protein
MYCGAGRQMGLSMIAASPSKEIAEEIQHEEEAKAE